MHTQESSNQSESELKYVGNAMDCIKEKWITPFICVEDCKYAKTLNTVLSQALSKSQGNYECVIYFTINIL